MRRAERATLVLEWLTFAVILGVFWAICLRYFGDGYVDDSYIFFRYAQHFAEGQGFSWNPGEGPVEGFSSLLWVLLLGLGAGAGIADVVALARPLGIAITSLALLAAWRFSRSVLGESSFRAALLVPAALALSPIVARHAINGMETGLAALTFAGLAWLWTRDRGDSLRFPIVLGGATTLSFLVRSDAIAFAVLGSVFVLISANANGKRRRRRLLMYGATVGVTTVAILLWKQQYFGSIVPLPAYMKLSVLRPRQSGLFTRLQANAVLGFVSYAAIPLVAGAAALAVGVRARVPAWRATLFASAGFFAYLLSIIPAVNFAHRFFTPLLFPLVASAYVAAIIGWRTLHAGRERDAYRAIATCIAAALLVTHNAGLYHPVRATADGDRSDALGELGRALAPVSGLSIAYSEAGQLPYFSGARFFDVAGLNDRGVALLRFRGNAIADFRARLQEVGFPDLYIDPPGEYTYAALAQQPEIANRCALWSWNGLRIGVRRDSPQRRKIDAALEGLRATPVDAPN